MVVKMYISGISALKEVKKHQLRAQFLLDSHKLKYEVIDISDAGMEETRMMMQREAKKRVENQPAQPPQFFNDDQYCGDYEDLEEANDNDELFKFLKLEEDITIENGGEGEDELFRTPKQDTQNEENEEDTLDDQDEKVELEVKEQCTINGVVYDIPPDRKINVGGRIINVDELIANDAEEISLEDVDDNLKKDFIDNDDGDEDKENHGEEEE